MKTKLFLILLFISSYLFAQNWSQVGTTQFTTNSNDTDIAFDNAGVPFMVYIDNSTKRVHVKKFNGTAWIDYGVSVSAFQADFVAIKINPSTNEPFVAFVRTGIQYLYGYQYNGSSWAELFGYIPGAFIGPEIKIHFNVATNMVRVGGDIPDSRYEIIERNYINGVGPNIFQEKIYTTNATHAYNTNNQFYDYTSFDHFYISHNFNVISSNSAVLKKEIGSAGANYVYSRGGFNTSVHRVSGIANENSFAAIFPGSPSRLKVYLDNTEIKNIIAENNIFKFRKNNVNPDNLYLMYEDSSNDIIFEKYHVATGQWVNLPSVGLNSNTNNIVKMKMNQIDGNMYVIYKDVNKISVKKYSIVTASNLSRFYVDIDATGQNNGTSWADAHTNLSDVLRNIGNNTSEIWIAEGTYIPTNTNKNLSFIFYRDNLNIYGGFEGTEITLTDRNLTAQHRTILSGDLSGNDSNVTFSGSDRNDNSYHVVRITAQNILLDGIIIEDGHARGSNTDASGAAVYVANNVTSVKFKNCEFNRNVGSVGGAIFANFSVNADFEMENCILDSNLSRYGSGAYILANNGKTVTIDITNTLFSNNTSETLNSSNKGITGSAAWIRASSASSTVTTTITNSTFVNNIDTGTSPNSEQGALALGRRSDGNSVHNATINNCIFYGNTGAGGSVTNSINRGHTILPTVTDINNSIGEDNFSNLTSLNNTSSNNPLFTDSVNNDFTLQSGSSAINSGDNNLIPAGVYADLLGNSRIHNTIVDMGCYEYGASSVATVNELTTNLDFTLYPNPVNNTLNIALDTAISKVVIYNIQGQKVKESNTEQVQVSNLSKGIYLIKIEDENGNAAMKKFIKK